MITNMQALHEQNQTSGSYSFGTYPKLLKQRDATCCIALLPGDTVMDPTGDKAATLTLGRQFHYQGPFSPKVL